MKKKLNKIYYMQIIICILIINCIYIIPITYFNQNTYVFRRIRNSQQQYFPPLIKKTNSYDHMSLVATRTIVDKMNNYIQKKGHVVICFATGSTPIGLYELLRTRFKEQVDWSRVITFNLDEYYGIPPENSQSYRHFMDENLFNHVPILKRNINFLNGMTKNPKQECERYERKIKQVKGIDITILGIGRNGHIGFNEPGSDFDSRTRKVELTQNTIEANKRFFDNNNPLTHALTMGIATIMESKEIILLASGKSKAEPIEKTLTEPVTSDMPASILTQHQHTQFIINHEAASKISYEIITNMISQE